MKAVAAITVFAVTLVSIGTPDRVEARGAPPALVIADEPGISGRSTLTLSAYGEVSVAPDMATLTFGVITEEEDVEEAVRANGERMRQVMSAVKAVGVPEADIRTARLHLAPVYDYAIEGAPVLKSYQVQHQITVIVTNMDQTGAAIAAAVAAGVDQVDGVTFGLRDATAFTDQARVIAVNALQAKAATYAQALGVRLGALRTLSEATGDAPPMDYFLEERADAVANETGIAIASGAMMVRVDVTGIFELER